MSRALLSLFLVLSAGAGLPSRARAQDLGDHSPFRRLDLPTPNEYRTGSGRPGSHYWQQRVDYRIRATLDPAANEVRATGTMHYVNHSPDTLPYLWLFVEQNLCDPQSITNVLNQPPLQFLGSSFDFSCQGFSGGLTLDRVALGVAAGRAPAAHSSLALHHIVYGTTMRVDLPHPLAPGASVDIDMAWHFKVPPQGGGRMGHDGPLYEIAQWYPRACVYDDVHGWNHEPYIGAGEFYLEYGSFDVALTVPAVDIVAATGQLLNPVEVLTANERARLAVARHSDTAVAVISAGEVSDPARTRPRSSGTLTWHFQADSVRDVAFTAGPGMRWDASGYHNILIETLYRASADKWPEANRMARETIKYFSEQWYPYPYSHATTVEGPIEGMEYPMLTFVPNSPTREDQQWALAHEFGHEWFPMIVGSNERLYPWMDEGFNTFIDLHNAANYFKGTPYGDSIESHPLHLAADHTAPATEQPLISNPTEVHDLFWTGYQKPALMLNTLRNEVLGPDRFDVAFRAYIRAWAFKHPTPADFFRLMRDASGMELDWFWRGWVMTTARLDQSVDSVSSDGKNGTLIYLHNRGAMVMPTELRIDIPGPRDNTSEDVVVTEHVFVKLPVEMWNLGPEFAYHFARKNVVRVEVDPRHVLPDHDRSNDVWNRPPH
ncbi:MAG TPA: M1 family metallopeptidase [Gemmatimonadales bacterium]|jgi:hypothetical protein